MFLLPPKSIPKEAVIALVSDAVSEGKQIDFKETVSLDSPDNKREFLKDVCAFANTSGGQLVYGVKEQRDKDNKTLGLAEKIVGVSGNLDQIAQQMQNTLRTGLTPRLQGIQFELVPGFEKGDVLVISIPRSLSAPHAVRNDSETLRFYYRNGSQNHPMDVGELRSAFLASDSFAERMKAFHLSRVAQIAAGDSFVLLKGSRERLIVHIIPASATDPLGTQLDLSNVEDESRLVDAFCSGGSRDWRHNIDGWVQYNLVPSGYTQVFRNGTLELVNSNWVERAVRINTVEKAIVSAVERSIHFFEKRELEPPYFVWAAITSVNGHQLSLDRMRYDTDDNQHIDRDNVFLPTITINDPAMNLPDLMRPMFDTIWQAAGWKRNMNYDLNGKWNPNP